MFISGDTQCSCPPFECLCSKNYSPGCRTFSGLTREDSSSYSDIMTGGLESVPNDCSVFQAIDKVLEDVACSYGHSTSYRLAAKVASDFDQAYYSSFADGELNLENFHILDTLHKSVHILWVDPMMKKCFILKNDSSR